jgi:hypothetical protein
MRQDIPIADKVTRALAYPFAPPVRSYVYVNGSAWPLVEFHRDHAGESLVEAPGGPVSLAHHLKVADIDPALSAEPRLPVIASGSNASPERLAQKFTQAFKGRGKDVVIPVVRAELHDFAPVYSAHISGYGSIPATLQHTVGAAEAVRGASTVFVTWLTPAQLERMHETEALGVNYGFARLAGIRLFFPGAFPDGETERAFAYISLRGSLHVDGDHFALDPAPAGRAGLRPLGQRRVQELVRDLVAPGLALDDFIAGNIGDEALRRRRIRLLRAFAHPVTHDGIAFAHGPAARLIDI